MESPIRVTYVHQDGLVTGSAISLKNLLSGFEPGTIQASVVLSAEGPVRALFEEAGAHVSVCAFQPFWTFPGPKWYQRGSWKQLKAFVPNKKLRDHILDQQPDIVHINDKAALAAGISLKGSKLPIVQHLRSNYHKTRSRLNAFLSARAISSYTDAFIAISEDEVDGFGTELALEVIYNTIHPNLSAKAMAEKESIRKEFTIAPHEIVVTFVGLLNELKGAWTFIETCGLIKKQLPGYSFRFVMVTPMPADDIRINADGRLVHPLQLAQELCSLHDISNEMIFTGYRKDALSIIAASQLLMIMNKQGVLGRQPFEAMSTGVPVIAVQGVNARTQIIRNNVNGLLAERHDAQLLATMAAELLQDEGRRQRMGEAGKRIALDEFNPLVNSGKVYRIYQRLLSQQA